MQTTVSSSDNRPTQSVPIDFAFVTAFPFVRDTILQHIEGYEIVHDNFASSVHYRGHIPIPVTDERYEVVVFMPLEKEIKHDEGITSIIQMIKRWHPAYIIKIGVADGIPGKVRLGDIVIADFVCHYEPTKQILGGELQREQLFPSDRLLYGRAFSYQSNEWWKNITLPWPAAPRDADLPLEPANRGDITLPWHSSPQDAILPQEPTNRGDITLPWPAAPRDADLPQEPANRGNIILPWPATPRDADLPQEPANRGDITPPRHPTTQTEVAFPKAHFGAVINSYENVTMDARALSQQQDEYPTLLAIVKDHITIARICAQQPYTPSFLGLYGICDYVNEPKKTNNYHVFSAKAATAFIVGLLRSCPVPPLIEYIHQTNKQKVSFQYSGEQSLMSFRQGTSVPDPPMDQPQTLEMIRQKEQKRPLLALCAQSLRPITKHEIMSSLDQEAISRPIEIVWLDFTDLESNWVMANPEVAVQRITDPKGPLHRALMRRKEVDFAFYGLMRIPLAFLIGHLIPSTQPVRLFDINPHPNSALETWNWPGTGELFPPLEIRGIPRRKSVAKRVLAICVSVSFNVFPRQIYAVGLHDALIVELKIPSPKRGRVRSEEQVYEYGRIFHDMLDLIIERCPAIKCIHIFYAGPMALAFHLAQQIVGDIHPPVVAWNYYQAGYDWGIDLTEASIGNPCIVRPIGLTRPSKKKDEYHRYFGD
jgi:nucleoside phosphorylase